MRNTFIETLTESARSDDDIFIISGDAGFGVFEDFRKIKPDRFLNAGIAEANMIGMAGGLSLSGFNVFVYNIIPFVLYRCFEQVRNDICYQRLPVTLVGIGSGVTYAPGGMTHYGVEDVALTATLPNLTVISPVDPVETAAAVRYGLAADGPVYIRIAKSNEPAIRKDGCPDIRKPGLINSGDDIAILGYGSILNEAVRAVERLKRTGVRVKLISVPMLQPFPHEDIYALIQDANAIITLEEHYRTGGLATRMYELFIRYGRHWPLFSLALPDTFLHDIKDQQGMRRKYGVDADSVVKTVASIMDTGIKSGDLLQRERSERCLTKTL